MINSKQRTKLRAIVHDTRPNLMIGKEGLSGSMIKEIDDVLNIKEIIKIKVLKNSGSEPKDLAIEIANKTKAEVVSVIGHTVILYRLSDSPEVAHIL